MGFLAEISRPGLQYKLPPQASQYPRHLNFFDHRSIKYWGPGLVGYGSGEKGTVFFFL